MKRLIGTVVICTALVSGCDGYLSVQGERSDRQRDPAASQPGSSSEHGGSASSEDRSEGGEEAPACESGDAERPVRLVRRLTVGEYVETVRRTVGVDVDEKAREILPSEVRADGFRNTAYALTVDLDHIQGYAELAGIIVDRLDVPAFVESHVGCRELTRACFEDVITEIGRRLLRGPVGEVEKEKFFDVFEAVVDEDGDFELAVSYVLEAMLQSPQFIYRIENQQGDGSTESVGGWELASRLSYFIWGGPPDEELMAAAEAGELSTPEQVTDQVERMLASPRADKSVERFIYDWLSLGRLASLDPNEEHYPGWSEALAEDMEEETLAFAHAIAREEKRPLSDLFDAQATFATPRLADHYGLESNGEGMNRYDLSPVAARGGLLTQGSVLTIGGDEASTVSRGLFLLRNVLCGDVSSPPPDVDTTPVPAEPGRSQREIAEARIANPQCGGCHSKFEPLAFGLSKFDGVGKYIETDEHGNKLRDDGEVVVPGEAEAQSYEDAAEMMELIAGSERVDRCLTRKVTQFAIGRKLTPSDRCKVREIYRRFREGGETYASLVAAIATSDLFIRKQTEEGGQQ